MNCFNHPAVVAVGLCKHCQRGLCRECAVEAAGSLSCRGACEQEVALVNQLAHRAGTSFTKTSRAYLRATAIYFLLAVVFLGFALRERGFFRIFLLIMAGVFAVGGGLYFRSAREFKQE